MRRKSKKSSFDSMSLKELVQLEMDVRNAIAAARERERGDIKRKLSEIAEHAGFSVSELFPSGRGRPAGKGKSVGVARYANPEDRADTWTGRGRKPNWLLERLKKGAKLADFAI